jgi:hypothetical protein
MVFVKRKICLLFLCFVFSSELAFFGRLKRKVSQTFEKIRKHKSHVYLAIFGSILAGSIIKLSRIISAKYMDISKDWELFVNGFKGGFTLGYKASQDKNCKDSLVFTYDTDKDVILCNVKDNSNLVL